MRAQRVQGMDAAQGATKERVPTGCRRPVKTSQNFDSNLSLVLSYQQGLRTYSYLRIYKQEYKRLL